MTIKSTIRDNSTNIMFEVRERRVAEKPHTIKELSNNKISVWWRAEPTIAMKIIRTKIIENLTKNYPKVAT